ncbi:MAG: ThiF family adenylyltransferase [Thiolinea sp.]
MPALSSTLGRAKIDVLAERVADIHPSCVVHRIEDFVEADNLDSLIPANVDFVIDCIDNFRTKSALIAHCKRHKIRIITLGGAGGQSDPTQIRLTDLSRSLHDPLGTGTLKHTPALWFQSQSKRRF